MVESPPYRLILLPVDGSEAMRVAATHTATLALATAASIAILGVIDTSGGFQFSEAGAATYERLRAETQAAIEATSGIVRGAGVARVEHLIMDGVPCEAILEVADEQGADLIVIGVERVMLGDALPESVVAHLIRHARCPVLIVPTERMTR